MKLIMLPLLFSVAFIGYQNRDRFIDQYNAAYPSDPLKQAAIEQCVTENHNFNRLDADDRKHCYRKGLGTAAVELAPAPSPSYAYSPSHLAGNDVRRQEANDSYHFALIPAAQAAPIEPQPAYRAPAASPRVVVHYTHHVTATVRRPAPARAPPPAIR
jgi:hypothetical protein